MNTLITNIEVGEIGEKASTQRTNFPFNSFLEMGGSFFGFSSSGAFLLGGDDDDGTAIDAYIAMPSLAIGGGKPVRTEYLYASLETDGTLYIKTTPNMDATRAVTIEFTPATAEYHTHREKLGEGDIAVSWGVEFGNVDGSDFSLSMMEILPIVKDGRKTRY